MNRWSYSCACTPNSYLMAFVVVNSEDNFMIPGRAVIPAEVKEWPSILMINCSTSHIAYGSRSG